MTADGLPGGLDQFGQLVDAFNGITSAREFASISACSTPGIKKRSARKDAPLTEPGSDRGALLHRQDGRSADRTPKVYSP